MGQEGGIEYVRKVDRVTRSYFIDLFVADVDLFEWEQGLYY